MTTFRPTAASVCLVLAATTAWAGDRVTGRSFATRSEVYAQNGMAATSQPLATQVALDVLKAGGSAVDAAIAANALLGLVEPTGNGIGGDLFAIVWDPETAELHGYNGSGRSPRSLTLEKLREAVGEDAKIIPPYGPLPVSVPGAVDGWTSLHERFGKLPLGEVLAPAIEYARQGAPITELIAYYWNLSLPSRGKYPGFLETFAPGGHAPRVGDVFRNPGLANTLQRIAEEGRAGFYEGEVAETIGAYMAENSGFLTADDLREHRGEWVDPVSVNYRGYDVWELPPNGQGIAALQMLQVLERHDVARMGFGSEEYIHLFTEAKKLAFADRARFYADPTFSRAPIERLLSDAYAAERSALIKERAMKSTEPGNAALEEGDTIYLCTADSSGMMVSLIQSNYRGMGSGMTPPGLGFCLQDRGQLFDLTPGRANSYEPGKRPFHTIIPAFITRGGKPYIAFGLMGGATQPQGHAQIVVNLVDFGMNLQEAGDAPRMVHTGSSQPTGETMGDGGQLHLETGISWDVLRGLQRRGHKLESANGIFGGYQAIRWDAERGVYAGASESRKDGQAAGY
ncbi:Putative gamma-glutamyltransferase YwrD [Planctomycetes bacterium Poly30]|uniref:Glutathione hydrolase proenzyme n=1 Tax=Saltatorellus ferox TaxID=2528018 RepID=A0A518EX44_9BACT|nr:Putative gamma-glutamyltransferase YwrD [Planctomycetes bacterium Poly30]